MQEESDRNQEKEEVIAHYQHAVAPRSCADAIAGWDDAANQRPILYVGQCSLAAHVSNDKTEADGGQVPKLSLTLSVSVAPKHTVLESREKRKKAASASNCCRTSSTTTLPRLGQTHNADSYYRSSGSTPRLTVKAQKWLVFKRALGRAQSG